MRIKRLCSFGVRWGFINSFKRLEGEPHARSSSSNRRGLEPSGIGSVLNSGINVSKTFPACCCVDSLCFWFAPLLPLLFLQYMVSLSKSQPLFLLFYRKKTLHIMHFLVDFLDTVCYIINTITIKHEGKYAQLRNSL